MLPGDAHRSRTLSIPASLCVRINVIVIFNCVSYIISENINLIEKMYWVNFHFKTLLLRKKLFYPSLLIFTVFWDFIRNVFWGNAWKCRDQQVKPTFTCNAHWQINYDIFVQFQEQYNLTNLRFSMMNLNLKIF